MIIPQQNVFAREDRIPGFLPWPFEMTQGKSFSAAGGGKACGRGKAGLVPWGRNARQVRRIFPDDDGRLIFYIILWYNHTGLL